MLTYLLAIFVAYIIYVVYHKWTCGICTCDVQMVNRVVVITGGNTGIGYETALDLAKRNAKVILACRSIVKGTTARDKIIELTGNKNVLYKQLDLASFKSVREFCDDILQTESKIDVLINNAGTGNMDNQLTEDNLPTEVQVNHLSPFLLTLLLLPLLKSSAPSRIINVSSIMHWLGTIDLENFAKPSKTNLRKRRTYSNTKLANILFTKKLSEDLKGTGVTVNALHPGSVDTDIFSHKYAFTRYFSRLMFKTRWQGAQTSIHLAVSPDLDNVSGKYFVDCEEAYMLSAAKDPKLADQLWDLSSRLVMLQK